MIVRQKIRVTKEFRFEMAHALDKHDGKCGNIHGHSYHLSVTVIGIPTEEENHAKNGMVMDFSVLKSIVKQEILGPLDHSLVLYDKSPHVKFLNDDSSQLLILKPYNPTCENLVTDFAHTIGGHLPKDVSLHSLKLRETDTCYAEWHASDNVISTLNL